MKKYYILLSLMAACTSFPAYAEERQIQCLANVIQYEAGAEAKEGKKAVAHVVINRTKSKKFPSTVCGVVSQRKQFSWYPRPNTRNKEAYEIARKVYSGQSIDNTRGSLFFHSTSIRNPWNLRRVLQIGRHIFYK